MQLWFMKNIRIQLAVLLNSNNLFTKLPISFMFRVGYILVKKGAFLNRRLLKLGDAIYRLLYEMYDILSGLKFVTDLGRYFTPIQVLAVM